MIMMRVMLCGLAESKAMIMMRDYHDDDDNAAADDDGDESEYFHLFSLIFKKSLLVNQLGYFKIPMAILYKKIYTDTNTCAGLLDEDNHHNHHGNRNNSDIFFTCWPP